MMSNMPDDQQLKLKLPYTVSEAIVAVTAVIGNSLVIVAFSRERKLRRRCNYYIISLATADLLVGLVGIPCAILSSLGLPEGLHSCLFTVSLLVVFCTISIFSLLAVSVDRFWAILHPMSYKTRINTKITLGIIFACWIFGAFIGFLPLLGWHAKTFEPLQCIFTKVMDYSYLVFLFFGTIVFPAILLTIFYVHIYQVILKQIKQMVSMIGYSNIINTENAISFKMLTEARKKEVKATQNLSIIVLFFVLCWMPLYTINCVQAFCEACVVPNIVMDLCIILSHLNSAANPLLYAYHLSDFQWALRSLLFNRSSSTDGKPATMRKTSSSYEVNDSSATAMATVDLNGKIRSSYSRFFVKRSNTFKVNFVRRANKLFAFGLNSNELPSTPPSQLQDAEANSSSFEIPIYNTVHSTNLNANSSAHIDANKLQVQTVRNSTGSKVASLDDASQLSKNSGYQRSVSYEYISIDDDNYYDNISYAAPNSHINNNNNNNYNNNNNSK